MKSGSRKGKVLKCVISQCGGRCLAADEKGCRIDSPKIRGLGRQLLKAADKKSASKSAPISANSKRFKSFGPTKEANKNLLQAIKSKSPGKIGQALLEWFKSLRKKDLGLSPQAENKEPKNKIVPIEAKEAKASAKKLTAKQVNSYVKELTQVAQDLKSANKERYETRFGTKEAADALKKVTELEKRQDFLVDSLYSHTRKLTPEKAEKVLDRSSLQYPEKYRKDLVGYIQVMGKLPSRLKKIDFTDNERSFADFETNTVFMGKMEGGATLWHEVGHFSEYSDGRILDRALAWRRDRWDKGFSNMNKLMPGYGYENDEIALTGSYRNKYLGKAYADDRATEVFSLGIEKLHTKETLRYNDEPGHLEWLINEVLPVVR